MIIDSSISETDFTFYIVTTDRIELSKFIGIQIPIVSEIFNSVTIKNVTITNENGKTTYKYKFDALPDYNLTTYFRRFKDFKLVIESNKQDENEIKDERNRIGCTWII